MKKLNKNQNQTIKVDQSQKKYLQIKLQEYNQTKNIACLQQVANTCVKKVCFKYAPNNNQTMQLYNASRNPNTQNQDILDLRQEAMLSLLQDFKTIKDNNIDNNNIDYSQIFKNCFSAINKYLYHLRGIQLSCRPFDYSIEQLQDNNIDIIINVRKGINQLIKNSDLNNISEFEQDEQDEQTQKTKKQLVINILKQLTPTQKTICKLLAYGLSERQIAQKLNRGKTTIHDHIMLIRKKALQVANN